MQGDQLSRGSSNQSEGLRAVLLRGVERLSGAHKYRGIYDRWCKDIAGTHPRKMNELLRMLDVRLDFPNGNWPPRVAANEPLVMIANHPFGIADGVVLAAMAEQLERPYKVLVNTEFLRIEAFREHCLSIDFSGTREAMATNLATRRQALDDLRKGVTLLAFPAGTVATAPRLVGRAQEAAWKPFTAGLVQKARASILPVFFAGQNSLLFHAVSHLSASARLSLLIAEFRRFPGRVMQVRVGDVGPYSSLAGQGDRLALTEDMFLKVHRLAPWAQGFPDEKILPPQSMRERPYKWDMPLKRTNT